MKCLFIITGRGIGGDSKAVWGPPFLPGCWNHATRD